MQMECAEIWGKGALTTFDNIGNGAFWTFEGGTSEKNTLYQAEMGLKITSKLPNVICDCREGFPWTPDITS